MVGRVSTSEKKLEKLIEIFEQQNKKIDKLINLLVSAQTEQFKPNRAKTEQLGEQTEQLLASNGVQQIRGRHREILALLINEGFHTYRQMAEKLNISQSRARAYITDLKNDFSVPLRQVRDPEGYKIGIDVRFVEQILASK